MIHDIKKKCEMFSSINKTNISITDVMSKDVIEYNIFDTPNFIGKNIDNGIKNLFNKYGSLLDHQVIMYKDRLKLCYLIYILEDKNNNNYIIKLGPFLDEVLSVDEIKYYGYKMKLSSENIRILVNFFSKIPFYEKNEIQNIFIILANILKSELDEIELIYESRENKMPKDNNFSDKFKQYDYVESNYEIEDHLLSLIEAGNIEELNTFLNESVAKMKLPSRHQFDPLRDSKNLAITLNSISARAAMKGGLNPHLVHSMSTKFAIEVEKQINVESVSRLNITIIQEYCTSVQKYSLVKYSQLIKEAIIFIRKNLANPINLDDIAHELHISREHLSRTFKKETTTSITEFIHDTKIHESLDLVKSKSYSINDIAYMFGYCNAAYYSSVFKKVMDVSPRQYQNN